jgi:hypothetical protein
MLRSWIAVPLIVGVFAALPAASSASTDFPFGWSAKQQTGRSVVFQYDNDWPTPEWYQCARDNVGNEDVCAPYKKESCNPGDAPDEPVRAFRFMNDMTPPEPRVQITFPRSPQNRRMIGSDLYGAKRENSPSQPDRRICGTDITFWGGHEPRCPQDFDDGEWISSPYYMPSDNRVYSNMHQEFGGARADAIRTGAPLFCEPGLQPPIPTDRYCSADVDDPNTACWFGSITFAQSDPSSSYLAHCTTAGATVNKVGACYAHKTTQDPAGEVDHLVATIPYQYTNDWGRHGYRESSNILRGEKPPLSNYYYAVALVSGPALDRNGQPATQKAGLCVLRTSDISQPNSWMAWNGIGFDARPSSAYPTPPADPNTHVCEPVASQMQPYSLTYNTYLEKYMLLGHGGFYTPDPPGFGPEGVYYMLSDDLLNWSDPQLVMKAPIATPYDPANCPLDTVAYPVLLDPNDPASHWPDAPAVPANPNFDHPGRRPDLYFTDGPRTSTSDCQPVGGGANLARIPIQFEQKQATFQSGTITDPDRGFTTAPASAGSTIGRTSLGSDYDPGSPDWFARAETNGGVTSWAYGRTSVNWNDGNDVWYGGAFWIPENFASNAIAQVDILSWKSTTGTGGVILKANDKFQLNRFSSATGRVMFGSEFDLPTRRWVWLEVHQRLGTTNAYSEAFVDGRLVSSSVAPNRDESSPITQVRHGIIAIASTGQPLALDVDRASVMGGQLGAAVGTGAYQAPKTPVGLRKGVATNDRIWLVWNFPDPADPPVSGYRVYEQASDGTWYLSAETGSTVVLDSVPAGSCDNRYRVTAIHNTTETLVPPNPTGTNVSESLYSSPISVDTTGCSP